MIYSITIRSLHSYPTTTMAFCTVWLKKITSSKENHQDIFILQNLVTLGGCLEPGVCLFHVHWWTCFICCGLHFPEYTTPQSPVNCISFLLISLFINRHVLGSVLCLASVVAVSAAVSSGFIFVLICVSCLYLHQPSIHPYLTG